MLGCHIGSRHFAKFGGEIMSSDDDRKKVALDEETYKKLTDFSRFNGLKRREIIATLVNLLLQDNVLGQRVIERTLKSQSDDTEYK
jgi:hypothetical protein